MLLKTLFKFEQNYQRDKTAAEEYVEQGRFSVQSGIELTELASCATIANLMLNLDEAITKE